MLRIEQPRLSHSQNFLRDPRLVDSLLDRSSIHCQDLVCEIGPGTGVITERLSRRCRRVIAVERDATLAAYLRTRFANTMNISIRTADFLCLPLPAQPYKVFASIPYAATTAIVTKLTAPATAPCDSYLIMQREAADRFTGLPRATLFATLLHPWFETAILHQLRRHDFRPVPKVESVLLGLHKRDLPLVPAAGATLFRDFVSYCFTAPQPHLYNTLQACVGRRLAAQVLRSVGLRPSATPSMVPGTLWILLFEHLKDAGGLPARSVVVGAEQRLRRRQAGLQKVYRTRVEVATRWPETRERR